MLARVLVVAAARLAFPALLALLAQLAPLGRAAEARAEAPDPGATLASPPDSPPAAMPSIGVEDHLTRARAHTENGRHDLAIDELRAAYELEPRPEILLGMARAYRQLGRDENAAHFYERFLAGAPAGPDRDAAERERRSIGGQAAASTADRAAASTAPIPSVAITRTIPSEPPTRQPLPLWKRWWFWAGVGIVAASAAALSAAALSSDPTSVPKTDLGNHRFFR